MASIQLNIVTPERTTFDETVEGVVVPMLDGEAGILAGHSPLIGRLAPGEVRVQQAGRNQRFFVDGGFVQVADNRVSILTGRALTIDQINVAEARRVLETTQISANDKPEVVEIKTKAIDAARAQIRLAGG
jgi:F-type H+-transporting ATPase subunit epsilon